jgi:hypothetical protein
MNFVLTGKAKTVFRIIELKAKREQEIALLRGEGNICRYDPAHARCTKPLTTPCIKTDCNTWVELFGPELADEEN